MFVQEALVNRPFVAAAALATVLGTALSPASWSVAYAQTPAITAQNWGASVGFKPDPNALTLPVGTLVDAANVGLVKTLLPAGLELLIRKYALTLRIAAYQPYSPSRAYIAATNAQRGNAVAKDMGADAHSSGLSGYVSGLPFPKPKTGLQVAYNLIHAYRGDDSEVRYDMTWISAQTGVETSELWRGLWLHLANRTDLDPRPSDPDYERERYRSAALDLSLEPEEKQGFGGLYFAPLDPLEMKGTVYVPAMRRILRMVIGMRGDAWYATDFLYQDIGGYLGAAEWMEWKILAQQTMLLPSDAGAAYGSDPAAVFALDKWPHWNPKVRWQPRPVYVLEAKPKLPGYPYRRMLMLVDAESYAVLYKEGFDHKGKLWKIILRGDNASAAPHSKPAQPAFGLALDLRTQHATLITYREVRSNAGLDMSALLPRRPANVR
jgi:hypothetical protein